MTGATDHMVNESPEIRKRLIFRAVCEAPIHSCDVPTFRYGYGFVTGPSAETPGGTMNTIRRESIHLVLSSLILLTGLSMTIGHVSSWQAARSTGSDGGLHAAIGGLLLAMAGLAALVGAFLNFDTRALLVLAGLGYTLGVPLAVVVATLATQTWQPLLGAAASAALIGFCVHRARSHEA